MLFAQNDLPGPGNYNINGAANTTDISTLMKMGGSVSKRGCGTMISKVIQRCAMKWELAVLICDDARTSRMGSHRGIEQGYLEQGRTTEVVNLMTPRKNEDAFSRVDQDSLTLATR